MLFWLRGVFIIIVPSFFHTGTKITYTVSYTHKWHIVNTFVTDKSSMCLKNKIKWFTPNLSDIVLKKIFSSSKCNVSHLILTISADVWHFYEFCQLILVHLLSFHHSVIFISVVYFFSDGWEFLINNWGKERDKKRKV